jgi:hypothetical protein
LDEAASAYQVARLAKRSRSDVTVMLVREYLQRNLEHHALAVRRNTRLPHRFARICTGSLAFGELYSTWRANTDNII